jgi:drug/metabolite transporter (DMT)-like permease
MTALEKRPPLSAFFLAFAAIYLIWGSTYLGIRVAVETMPPFFMAAVRFAIAGAILLALIKWQGGPMPTAAQWRVNAVVGTFLLLGGNGLVAWAEQHVPSGLTALTIGIQPVLMVLTEWAWPGGRRPTPLVFVGMGLGFVGVAWLFAPWETDLNAPVHVGGILAILMACVAWAVGSIYSRHSKPGPPFTAAAAQMLCGSLALAVVAAARGEMTNFDLSAVSDRSWIAFGYLVIIGSLVGFSTFVWLMKHSTPARVSTYAYVNPVVAVFLGWLVLHEPISGRTLYSAAIIVVAVVIVTTQKDKKPRPAMTPLAASDPKEAEVQ